MQYKILAMNIFDFKALGPEFQEELVLYEGLFIANYVDDSHTYDVYLLYDFYVAYCYDLNKNEKVKITSHEDPFDLPYIWKLRFGT